ncbi:hypothetical protein KIN20_035948 [Parelaphostrongylus tenuis]|uniref:Uncharacterized protein n=1 Tax=Parelaphostrongylus tenuis TaxID=148309 RepID=A0AAD5RCG0_PARTN|nr:hypothetical protein KIN20_035948 [Parelaphostrongylus tenuis]
MRVECEARFHFVHGYALELREVVPTDFEVLSFLRSSTGRLVENSSTAEKVKCVFEFQDLRRYRQNL